uniref:Uncharacterized protein n=1 Tax=Nelumbo nucifera TaxID=4432 RepID=A0A822YCR9_NELNU|nr:TPA_asm: hypothetical protein HUJ06_030779 [Nelumbo nucifera]
MLMDIGQYVQYVNSDKASSSASYSAGLHQNSSPSKTFTDGPIPCGFKNMNPKLSFQNNAKAPIWPLVQ